VPIYQGVLLAQALRIANEEHMDGQTDAIGLTPSRNCKAYTVIRAYNLDEFVVSGRNYTLV